MTDELPPPAFYRYQFESYYGKVWRSDQRDWNGCKPVATEGVYTADQMRKAIAEEREACAKIADDADKSTHPADIAAAIRQR